MIKIIASFAILLIFSSFIFADPRPPLWKELFEIKATGAKVYYDANGFERKDEMSTGFFLVSSRELFPVQLSDGKIIQVRSIVKRFIANCKSAVMSPVATYYLADAIPVEKSKIIASAEYDLRNPFVSEISRDSIFYTTLCAKEI